MMHTKRSAGGAVGVAVAVARWTGRVFLFALLASVVGAVVVLMVLPRATQGAAMTVLTGSMTPGIPVGSVVLVRPVDPATLEVGDIATYQKEPDVAAYVTHRIIDIDSSTAPTTFTFKGDANDGPDVDPVPADAVVGEVWFHVPYLGSIRDTLHGLAGLSLLLIVVLVGYALSQVAGAVRDRHRAKLGSTEVTVDCDRAIILVEIPTRMVFGMPPGEAAKEWGGILVRQAERSFTVALAPEPWDLPAIVRDLEVFEPVSLEIIEAPTPVRIRLDEHEAKVWDTVPTHDSERQEHAQA